MKFKVVYANESKMFDDSDKRTVGDYKEDLSKVLSIPLQYIVLKYKGSQLEDDKYIVNNKIKEGHDVQLNLKVNVKRVHSEVSDSLFLEYDDRLSDLKKKLCAANNIPKIRLKEEEKWKEENYCRECLIEVGHVFVFERSITVTVTNKRSDRWEIEAFENEKVKWLAQEFVRRGISRMGDVLMANDVILDNPGCRLFKYAKEDHLSVYVGFSVVMTSGEERLKEVTVNVATAVSDLRSNVAEILCCQRERLNLTYEGKSLEDGETLGSSLVGDGDRIDVGVNVEEERGGEVPVEEGCLGVSVPDPGALLDLMVLIMHKGVVTEETFMRIKVPGSSSVQSLKDLIPMQLHINMCGLDVYYLGDVFLGGDLHLLGVQDNDLIILKQRKNRRDFSAQFVIKVNTVDTKFGTESVRDILIDPFLTVGGLKQMIRSQDNVSVDRIRILLEGENLRDDIVFWELDVENGCEVRVVVDDIATGEDGGSQAGAGITVRNALTNEERLVDIETDERILEVEKNLARMFGLKVGDFVLSHNGEILKSDNSLSSYSIGEADQLVVSHSLLIKYYVSATGNSSRVNRYAFMPGDTVLDFKLRIKKLMNIDTKFINLTYDGQSLEDQDLLEDHDIENECYLIMISTLSGGRRSTFCVVTSEEAWK